MPVEIEGAVAVITGSSRGIGKAVALELARIGADVVVCARTESERDDLPGSIAQTAEAIRAIGRRALAVRMDVSNEADVRAMVDRTVAEFGKIDILINNAGITSGPSLLDSEVADLDQFLAINVRGAYLCSRLIAPVMIEGGNGGCIINVSSGAGRIVEGSEPANRSRFLLYGMSKSALDRFTVGIADELMPHNISAISLYPGFTLTERTLLMLPPGFDTSRAEPPETSAKAVAILCRNVMAYTGQIVNARELLNKVAKQGAA